MSELKEQLDLLMIKHAGKFIACTTCMEVKASGYNRERVRLDALAQGLHHPVMLYCRKLMPDNREKRWQGQAVLKELDRFALLMSSDKYRSEKLNKMTEEMRFILQCLVKEGRDDETCRLVEQLETEE